MQAPRFWLCRCALLALAAAPAARAALPPLPAPQVLATVLFNLGPRIDSSTLGAISLSNPDWGDVGTDPEGMPGSSLLSFARMSNTGFAPLFGSGASAVNFFFAIDGPGATVPVLIDAAGAVSASASTGASFVVSASWDLWSSSALQQQLAGDAVGSPQASGGFADSFGHTVSLTLETGHVYFVRLRADAEAAATDVGSSASARAFVDPVFRIGPGVDPALYTVGLSAGIGNAPVPEPPAAALLAAGLAVVLRRLQRTSPPSARRASAMVS